MNLSLVSVRYAKALFKLSVEKGVLEDVYKDLQLLSAHCTGGTDFCEFVHSPIVKAEKKKALFKEVYEDVINPITLGLLNLIVDNNREEILNSVFRSFSSFYKKEKNIKTVTVYSAVEMDSEFRNEMELVIAKELNCHIELSVVTKTDLLGGFILKVDDKMIDASIMGKLKRVRSHLVQG